MFHRLDFGKTNDLHFLKLNQEEKEALLKYFLKKRNEANEPVCVCAQLDLILCDPMYYSLPGSSVHGIFQARLLEWVASSYSRGSPNPGIESASLVSPALAGGFFTAVPPGKP